MTGYVFAIALSAVVVTLLFFLLRTRRIREKYAGIWIVLSIAVVVLGAFPELAFWLSRLVGVQTPVNLLFAVGFAVLLAVCIQLSSEVSNLEEETRTLAEEIALLRLEVRTGFDRGRELHPPPPDGASGPSAAHGAAPAPPQVDGSTDVDRLDHEGS
ncbi:DUF2304 domain-containing protein [Cellulomonas fimi]|uniref:DUF2304 domain-containing protein n=1 Tax=Cellulomonas fimi TaxID=1708 RepID=A0A7Y0M0N1_CELFI|nr:DUF2304 domain-containing protein [Cellulomonas fimi]NMR20878.1 DUF2304 domain-containing protein [Cellulomonas fimi]